jgi:competence protein ComEC
MVRSPWRDRLPARHHPRYPARPPRGGVAAWLDDFRARLTKRIEAAVGGDAGAISAAFVTGDHGAISPGTNLAMRWSGMAHLLSISGVHIAIVVGGTLWITRALLALIPWIALRWPLKPISAGAAAAAGTG